MSANKAPAFQFYAKDWMDFKVQRLSLQAMGAYINLLAFMWKDSENQCSMPDNEKFIAKILSCSVRKWKILRSEIQHDDAKLFLEVDGKLVSERLSKESQKQAEHRLALSEAGTEGANKRWQGHRGSHNHPIVPPMAKNSSSSSSSSAEVKTYSDGSKKEVSAWFEEVWAAYPTKDGKKQAFLHYKITVKTPEDRAKVKRALENYKRHLAIETWKKPKNGSTWFNNWQDWVSWEEPPKSMEPSGHTEVVL